MCDEPILKGEARAYVDNFAVHGYCDINADLVCTTPDCAFRDCIHAGECMV